MISLGRVWLALALFCSPYCITWQYHMKWHNRVFIRGVTETGSMPWYATSSPAGIISTESPELPPWSLVRCLVGIHPVKSKFKIIPGHVSEAVHHNQQGHACFVLYKGGLGRALLLPLQPVANNTPMSWQFLMHQLERHATKALPHDAEFQNLKQL